MTTVGNNEAHQAHENVHHLETPEQLMNFYDQWSEKYESHIAESQYNGPREVAALFQEFVKKDAKILDVCAGTGAIGELLSTHGYHSIDALDGSKEMLDKARQKVRKPPSSK